MMIFFGIVLLLINLHILLKGNMVNKLLLDMYKYRADKESIDQKETTDLMVRLMFYLAFSVVYLFTLIVFLIVALNVDVYTFPTVAMIAWVIASFPIAHIRSRNKSIRHHTMRFSKTRTPAGTISSVLYCMYFIYILALLMI